MRPQHIRATTYHKRLGDVSNAFRYGVDYVLVDPDSEANRPALFSRNRSNLMALHDTDHGGPRGAGRGAAWVHEALAEAGLEPPEGAQLLLLAQPRMIGTRFTPVSFWIVTDRAQRPIAFVAEVNNTFGERHSYLCAHPDLRPIEPSDTLEAQKVFHVSPFQPVEGRYRFNLALDAEHVAIRIDYRHEGGGLLATLEGKRTPLTSASVAGALLRRPLGALRVLALIHYQALKLWWKRAPFRHKPAAPASEISR